MSRTERLELLLYRIIQARDEKTLKRRIANARVFLDYGVWDDG